MVITPLMKQLSSLVSCHSHHSEGKMETCTPLFNFLPTIVHPLCPIFQLAISVISAAIMHSDTGARKPLYEGVGMSFCDGS